MYRMRPSPRLAWAVPAGSALLALLLAAVPVRADEGMWTLQNLPLQRLRDRYGFTPDAAWIEHVQKASISFGGGSGAFVSPNGLALTNHHVAMGQLAKMSTPEHNYLRDGFFARSEAEEMQCPDLELKVLVSAEDVTGRVLGAVDAKAADKLQNAQRKAAIARIEKEASGAPASKGEVIELYQGGEYWLYRYHTYKDVRLVCAPEEQTAFFGGDLDNFSYPRHDLDFAFFRVYEDGRPVHPEHWLAWSQSGAHDGELVLVSGHPGTTRRLRTVAQLEYERDFDLPLRIKLNEERLAAYRDYEKRGPEQARQARDRIRGLENNLKRQRGFLETLRDPALMKAKREAEAALRARVAKNAEAAKLATGAWDRIAAAERTQSRRSKEILLREWTRLTRLLDIADGVVHMPAETAKPNEQRFREYRDSNLESQRFRLFSRAPVYPEIEETMLAEYLKECRDELGANDAFVMAALGGREPAEVARELVAGTKLGDPAVRRQLVEGGVAAVAASTDPLVAWMRGLDPSYRELRTWREDNVESVESLDGGKIARARFLLDGHAVCPDATGSLRLSYGTAIGYPQLTTLVPWTTTFAGLFDRADSFGGKPPFDLAARVAAHRKDIEPTTPLDFVCTDDIIGGNSGSPVVNRAGEYVGLVFDGNVQSFAWDYAYSDEQARCVAVHSRALIEALRKIYDMNALADEVEGPRR
jgi:hypothetical protein